VATMTTCSYVVIPAEGAAETLTERLAALPGCDVARARNRDVLLLVTETSGPEEDHALRTLLERTDGVLALILTFGELMPQP